LAEDDQDQADPERKRRRRRSRRGRRGQDEGSAVDSQDGQLDDQGFEHTSSAALSGAPVAYVEPGQANATAPAPTPAFVAHVTPTYSPVAETAPAVTAPVTPAAAPVVVASVAAPVVAAPVIAAPAIQESLVFATPAPVEQVSAAVTAAPLPPAVAAPTPVVPAVAPVATPNVVATPADTATLHAIVQSAGLQWVESKPGIAEAFLTQVVVQVKLGREPKPAEIVSDVPLTQVETKK